MAFGNGEHSLTINDILTRTTELDILNHYFNVSELPIIIHSPLRQDNRPSFGLYTLDGNKIYYTDLATKDRGGLFDLLMKYWGVSYKELLKRLWEDLPNFSITDVKINNIKNKTCKTLKTRDIDLQCKVREWKDHDLEYWNSFGISLEWLKFADIYPISHKIVIREGQKYTFGADKYAYAYVERKEGKVTLKIYQPFNTYGYKWSNRHDRSVISLWTKVPEFGEQICICSSMKDALCLWANTGIPSLAIQGEGYNISDTAINELKRRYKNIYILLDNDEAGLQDARKLSESTGFINVVLPKINNAKDVSDLYKSLQDPIKFKEIILNLFNNSNK